MRPSIASPNHVSVNRQFLTRKATVISNSIRQKLTDLVACAFKDWTFLFHLVLGFYRSNFVGFA